MHPLAQSRWLNIKQLRLDMALTYYYWLSQKLNVIIKQKITNILMLLKAIINVLM